MAETKSKTYVKVFVTKTNRFRVEVTDRGEHFPLSRTGELFHRRYQVSVGGESWNMGKGAEHREIITRRMEKLLFSLIEDYVSCVLDVQREHIRKGMQVTFSLKEKKIRIGGDNV